MSMLAVFFMYQMSMNVWMMTFTSVNKCVTTHMDHIAVSVLMVMNSIVMDFHAQVRNNI